MAKKIILISSLKRNQNYYTIRNELLSGIVQGLSQKFEQVHLVNLPNPYPQIQQVNQVSFEVTPDSFLKYITENQIKAIFTLAGGKLVQSFIFQLFTDFPELQKTVELVGVDYPTLKILSNRAETEQFLLNNRVKFPNVKVLDQHETIDPADWDLTFPTRLRVIKPQTRSLGLFYNLDNLNQAIKEHLTPQTTLQLEESVAGDKEIEVIGIRDKYQNVQLLIHNEKIDPVGVHRDHSLVVYPTVTLLDRELTLLDRIARQIMKELVGPIFQIRFAVGQDQQYRVLSIHSDLTTSDLITAKIKQLNLASIIVDLACGGTILEVSQRHPRLLTGDLDFFTVVGPNHEFANFSVKHLITFSHQRANSLIMMMENDLVMGIRNTLIELCGNHRQEIEQYLTKLSDNYLVRQMMNVRIFRILFIIEAIRRDFLLSDLAEITKIDTGILQILKLVTELIRQPNWQRENSWQQPNYAQVHLFFPVNSKQVQMLNFTPQQVLVSFDVKKIDPYLLIYHEYLNQIIWLLVQNHRKVVLINNSLNFFSSAQVTTVQAPLNLMNFPKQISELFNINHRTYEFGVIQNGEEVVYSPLIQIQNHESYLVDDWPQEIRQLPLKSAPAMTYSFNLSPQGEIKDLLVSPSLSRAFYLMDPSSLNHSLTLFVTAKLAF